MGGENSNSRVALNEKAATVYAHTKIASLSDDVHTCTRSLGSDVHTMYTMGCVG